MSVFRNHLGALCVGLAVALAIGCGDSARSATDPVQVPVPVTTGSLEITVTSSGSDLDGNGYGFSIAAANGLTQFASAPANGTTTVTGLAPGNYSLSISDVAPNCDVVSPGVRDFVVAMGKATKADFAVRCGGAPEIGGGTPEITFALGGGWDDDATPRQLWTVSSNGGPLTQLTTDQYWHEKPSWSHDGTRMLFGSDRGGFGVWMLDTALVAVNLTKGVAEDFGARWSADGTRIAFYSRTNGRLGVFIMNADGTNRTHVMTGTSGQDLRPDLSPDGNSIVFENRRDDGTWGISTVRVDGTGLKQLTSNSPGDYDPTWSPDGSMILFYRIASGGQFYTIKPDGTGLTRIAADYIPTGSPAWSPDGRKIAFTGRQCQPQGSCTSGIYIVGLDGTAFTPPWIGDVVGDVAWRSRPSR